MKFLLIAIFLVSIIVGLGRFTVPGHALGYAGSYEAVAHIWVGMLVVLVCLKAWRLAAGLCLGVITLIEVAAFLAK